MDEETIQLTLTKMQARTIWAVMELARQTLAVGPGVPVYPNLGTHGLEMDLVKSQLTATQDAVNKQLEKRWPIG